MNRKRRKINPELTAKNRGGAGAGDDDRHEQCALLGIARSDVYHRPRRAMTTTSRSDDRSMFTETRTAPYLERREWFLSNL